MGNPRPLANTCQCHSSRSLHSAPLHNCCRAAEKRHLVLLRLQRIYRINMNQLLIAPNNYLIKRVSPCISPVSIGPLCSGRSLCLRHHSWPPSRSAVPRCRSQGTRPFCRAAGEPSMEVPSRYFNGWRYRSWKFRKKNISMIWACS